MLLDVRIIFFADCEALDSTIMDLLHRRYMNKCPGAQEL
jgi:hypothetical protein